jgi:uncharacterized protein (TIGR02594 family)
MKSFLQGLTALFSWLRPGHFKIPATDGPKALIQGVPMPEEPAKGEPEWLKLARADLGIRELPGAAANPAIMRAWEYCDYKPPNGDETAWCSAKANEWLQRAGLPGTRAPNARSWLKWGAGLDKPKPGCIAVFWRDKPDGWEGHVALYLGPGSRPKSIKVLGGNQGNGVTIAEYSTEQLLGYRWPTPGSNSRTLKAQSAGLVLGDGLTIAAISGKAIVESLPDALAIGEGVTAMAAYWPWAALIGIAISILARMVTIWARVSDWQAKGV